ncbi:hypothetical protein SETIT_2G311300v2 [Setaria italica]|uniref:Reverse transcriptase zinc-binding domain-containing protein n=1 Tax=Setaria italica TaxID=4555 RepID=A0A368Q568_SETIT|nr:hypothetical protein SETIT_2G311300v2 [Setaria italica]
MFFEDYNCVQCIENCEETLSHLFFECPISQACWIFLGINWDVNLPPLDMIIQAREQFGNCIFREIVIIASWAIWTHRNGIIFDGLEKSLARWKHSFEEELKLPV